MMLSKAVTDCEIPLMMLPGPPHGIRMPVWSLLHGLSNALSVTDLPNGLPKG
ncbi:MAG: hypothetical protein BWY76_02336 [bacterium ADurb.Bin429]|nr:MAG: hypothetical protein BWY76_02336 [bacterium ADurb.Bin429]